MAKLPLPHGCCCMSLMLKSRCSAWLLRGQMLDLESVTSSQVPLEWRRYSWCGLNDGFGLEIITPKASKRRASHWKQLFPWTRWCASPVDPNALCKNVTPTCGFRTGRHTSHSGKCFNRLGLGLITLHFANMICG